MVGWGAGGLGATSLGTICGGGSMGLGLGAGGVISWGGDIGVSRVRVSLMLGVLGAVTGAGLFSIICTVMVLSKIGSRGLGGVYVNIM